MASRNSLHITVVNRAEDTSKDVLKYIIEERRRSLTMKRKTEALVSKTRITEFYGQAKRFIYYVLIILREPSHISRIVILLAE